MKIASATATEKTVFPRMAYKKGISAASAPSPAACTEPRTAREATATRPEAIRAGGKTRFISLPASRRTGAIKKAFKPA